MTRQRKTMDVWEFWVDYGQGYEHECTELGYYQMLVNRKAYRENLDGLGSLEIRKKRKPLDFIEDHAHNARAEKKAREEWRSERRWNKACQAHSRREKNQKVFLIVDTENWFVHQPDGGGDAVIGPPDMGFKQASLKAMELFPNAEITMGC